MVSSSSSLAAEEGLSQHLQKLLHREQTCRGDHVLSGFGGRTVRNVMQRPQAAFKGRMAPINDC